MKRTIIRKKVRVTKFIRVLEGWNTVVLTVRDSHQIPYIIAPTLKIYRYAFAWEKPSLVIDANILPAEHHIRLVRVTDKPLCRLVHKTFRKRQRLLTRKR